MSEGSIVLTCQSCGGKLEVCEDMDRFACGYCGAEMIVQRRGGTVALKAVRDAIEKVQVGTDKTAAELAIARYQEELRELQRKRSQEEKKNGDIVCRLGCGGLLAFLGISLAGTEFGLWVLGAGVVLIGAAIAANRYRSKRPDPVLARMRQLEQLIAERKRLADS